MGIRSLGNHRPRTIAKAGLFGAISSSCSYAGSALAKTLFARGADFTAAQAFMFASTNLVVALGVVLWLLIGWQFTLAEFIGGTLILVLLALVLPRVIRPNEVRHARQRIAGGDESTDPTQTHEPDHQHRHADTDWRSSASSARSATSHWPQRCGPAASTSAAWSRSCSPT